MHNNVLKLLSTKSLVATFAASAVLLGFLAFSQQTGAHQDPGACTASGVGLSLSSFRSDGTTPIVGSVAQGETIVYKSTLSHLGGANCNFEGGTLSITAPDGTVTIVASPATPVVPLVTSGSPFTSVGVNYVVSYAHSGGDGILDATSNYSGGTSHTPNVDSTVGASNGISVLMESRIIIVKDVIGNPDPTDFTFNNNFGSPHPATFMLDEDANGTLPSSQSFAVSSGTYAVSEDPITGWQLESATCDQGETVGSIDVAPGEIVTCTFVNEELISITLVKNTVGGDGSFDFNMTGTGLPASAQLVTVGNTATQVFNNLDQDDEFSIAEVVPSGWDLTSATCTGGETPASITPEIGEDVTCTFTNTQIQALVVTKTANTSFDKKWTWTINKSADDNTVEIQEGQTHTVNYSVTVNASFANINHAVNGTITVTNPVGNPTASVTGVTDDLDVSVANPTVDCSANPLGFTSFPHALAAGESLICTYSGSSGGADTKNTATITTTGDVPGGSGDAAVTWGVFTNEIDECVDVTDSNDTDGVLTDTICANETLPHTYQYGLTFGPLGGSGVEVAVTCGVIDHLNTARFFTNDTPTIGQDSESVNVDVNCIVGCTLTQGYWKTHNASFKGGAPVDDGWLMVGAGKETTAFFTSGKTWFEVFWTAPKGNAWYNLAHQYMAAKLNILNGAVPPASVSAAITSAEALFNNALYNTPAEFAALAKNSQVRKDAITWAGILGSFNEGLIGPGHCDEQNPI